MLQHWISSPCVKLQKWYDNQIISPQFVTQKSKSIFKPQQPTCPELTNKLNILFMTPPPLSTLFIHNNNNLSFRHLIWAANPIQHHRQSKMAILIASPFFAQAGVHCTYTFQSMSVIGNYILIRASPPHVLAHMHLHPPPKK